MREEAKAQRRWPTPEILRRAQFVDDAPSAWSIPKPQRDTSRCRPTRSNATARSAAAPPTTSSASGSAIP